METLSENVFVKIKEKENEYSIRVDKKNIKKILSELLSKYTIGELSKGSIHYHMLLDFWLFDLLNIF